MSFNDSWVQETTEFFTCKNDDMYVEVFNQDTFERFDYKSLLDRSALLCMDQDNVYNLKYLDSPNSGELVCYYGKHSRKHHYGYYHKFCIFILNTRKNIGVFINRSYCKTVLRFIFNMFDYIKLLVVRKLYGFYLMEDFHLDLY